MISEMSKEKSCLILDADHDSLTTNFKKIYLGYWCLENYNNSFRELDNFNVINSKSRDEKEIEIDIKEIKKIYNSLITELSYFLNKFHNKQLSVKYWEIIIGPWLKIFLTIVRERFSSLNIAIKNYDINEVALTDFNDEDFYVHNVDDFEEKASKNINGWNSMLYAKIIKVLNYNFKILTFESKRTESRKKGINLKKKILKFFGVFNYFSKKSKYFIYSSGLKFFDTIKLQLHLKQFPSIFLKDEYKKKKIDLNLRKDLSNIFNKTSANDYEKIVRSLISDLIPTDVLENFKELEKKSLKLNWPENPDKIFTSTGYHSDEIFKIYLANKVEKGSKYIVSQHGAQFTHKNNFIELGYDKSHSFFSWGDLQKKKCVPLFNIKNIKFSKINTISKGKKLFFFMPKMSKQRKRLYDDYGQMIRDNISVEKILFNLSNKIKNSCILKLYPNEDGYKKLEDKILKEIIFKRQKFLIDRITPKKKIFENSKLILNYSDGTSFLETISSDVPTIIFLPNLNWINLDAKRDYEKLLESKILFNNEKQMSKHINNIFNDVSSWWNNSRVKNCKSNFEKKYSQRPIKNALSFLANEIEKVI